MRGFQLFKLLTVACVACLRPTPSAPWLALAMLVAIVPSQAGDRVHEGLLALYDFRLAKGEMVKDRSGAGQPLDLKIENPKNVRRSEGGVRFAGRLWFAPSNPLRKSQMQLSNLRRLRSRHGCGPAIKSRKARP